MHFRVPFGFVHSQPPTEGNPVVNSRILVTGALPQEASEVALQALFAQCDGFDNIEMSSSEMEKTAKITFDSAFNAQLAYRNLFGFKLTATASLVLHYSTL